MLLVDPFEAPVVEKLYDVITVYLHSHTQKEPNIIHTVCFFQKVSYTIRNPVKTLKKSWLLLACQYTSAISKSVILLNDFLSFFCRFNNRPLLHSL